MDTTQIERLHWGRGPAAWLAILGPGAIVASLTIGAGELVFSSRGGAIFGYRLLSWFLLICLAKWALVIVTARHLVVSGAHPLQRWCELPGPRGWLVWVYLLIGIVAFPLWIAFHASTIGTLVARLTGTSSGLFGASHYAWGLAILAMTMGLVWSGGYERLERVQMAIVVLLLLSVSGSLVFLHPNWHETARGLVTWTLPEYPPWIVKYPDLAQRPLWVELASYVGVLGGSGYDYLAYCSFLRDKRWGAASSAEELSTDELHRIAADQHHPLRSWLWLPWIDATVSFLAVFFFAGVFVLCGAVVLRPAEQVPAGDDLLSLQAQFVAIGAAWMRPLYYLGAFLALFGTLYGTIEVAPTVAREMANALRYRIDNSTVFHRRITTWVGGGGAVVLVVTLVVAIVTQGRLRWSPVTLLDPANLFTGVTACGIIGGLACWSDVTRLPSKLRAGRVILALNAIGCPLFIAVGARAYGDKFGSRAIVIPLLFIGAGCLVAYATRHRTPHGALR